MLKGAIMGSFGNETRRLFQSLRRQWLPKPDLNKGFLDSLDGFSQLQSDLRSDGSLRQLSLDMYSDLDGLVEKTTPADEEESRPQYKRLRTTLTVPEVHEILHIIQMMEIAWMNAKLDDFDAHPLNRGWVAAFHRWAMMPAFRRVWPVLRTDFSRSFIEYCEKRFSLSVTYSKLQNLNRSARPTAIQKLLIREFQYEWPEIDSGFLNGQAGPVWYVTPQIVNETRNGTLVEKAITQLPLGFVAALPPASQNGVGNEASGSYSCDQTTPELRFWVRPQHRFLGVARHLLNEFALKVRRENLLDTFYGTPSSVTGQSSVCESGCNLVTRYFVRTGQSGGQGLRRRMQLGFLYEYGFRRQDMRPYDEYPRTPEGKTPHPSCRGLNLNARNAGKETVVPTILRTTWHHFFESARSMSMRPSEFDEFQSSASNRS